MGTLTNTDVALTDGSTDKADLKQFLEAQKILAGIEKFPSASIEAALENIDKLPLNPTHQQLQAAVQPITANRSTAYVKLNLTLNRLLSSMTTGVIPQKPVARQSNPPAAKTSANNAQQMGVEPRDYAIQALERQQERYINVLDSVKHLPSMVDHTKEYLDCVNGINDAIRRLKNLPNNAKPEQVNKVLNEMKMPPHFQKERDRISENMQQEPSTPAPKSRSWFGRF